MDQLIGCASDEKRCDGFVGKQDVLHVVSCVVLVFAVAPGFKARSKSSSTPRKQVRGSIGSFIKGEIPRKREAQMLTGMEARGYMYTSKLTAHAMGRSRRPKQRPLHLRTPDAPLQGLDAL